MCGAASSCCLPSWGELCSASHRSAALDARERQIREAEERLCKEQQLLFAEQNRLKSSAEPAPLSHVALDSYSAVDVEDEPSCSSSTVKHSRCKLRALGKLDLEHGDPEENLQKIMSLFDEHKVMLAGRLLEEFKRRESEAGRQFSPDTTAFGEKISRLERLHERVIELRERLASDDDSWELVRKAFGIEVRHQPQETGVVRVRLDVEIHADVLDILSLLREIDLWKSWVPSFGGVCLNESGMLAQTSFLNLCFDCSVRFPQPMLDRKWTFAVNGIDCLNVEDSPQQIVILLDSRLAQENCPKGVEATEPSSPNLVKAQILNAGIIITPKGVNGRKETLMQMVGDIDPNGANTSKMKTPRWLLNMCLRNLCFLILLEFQKPEKITRTEPFLSRTTDPTNEFYAFIRRRLAEYEFENAPQVAGQAPPRSKAEDLWKRARQALSPSKVEDLSPQQALQANLIRRIMMDQEDNDEEFFTPRSSS